MAERMFGTNGVRGVINEYLTCELSLQMGKAIGLAMKGNIVIATDTRVSVDMIKTSVAAGIMATGYNVIDLGIVPTPALQFFVKTHSEKVAGGVMITASHNPPQFNGIKCISSDGTEASRVEEVKVEELYNTEITCVPWNKVGKMERFLGAGEEYIDSVLSFVDREAIRNANLTVCLDCANGAAFQTTPLLLKKLGVRAITLNCNAQGEFPGHQSEPVEENLIDLMSLVKKTGSNIGIAHDGDADRCVFISSEGKYVSGDKCLAILSKYILSKKKGIIVTPVSSSLLVEEVVNASGGSIVYTAVGSPIVARKMMENGGVFGGEENGGMIFPDQQYCRDGAMAIAVMLECIVKTGPLNKQLAGLPVYYTEKKKVDCPNDMKKKVSEYIQQINKDVKVDDTDGLKFIYDDGWVLARPSGTEPIFRIYSESKNEVTAKERADKFEIMVLDYLDPEGIHEIEAIAPKKKKSVKD
ncbi:MAG: phosphoglucosamine mutase [Candidatus Methanogranum gryphiswaldense]|nr:MAG: phosphoglucosamine mutase [Candidatus Methanogranum sp. U3.2.1]